MTLTLMTLVKRKPKRFCSFFYYFLSFPKNCFSFFLFFSVETLGGIGFRLALTFVVDVFVVELDSGLDVVAVLKIKTQSTAV